MNRLLMLLACWPFFSLQALLAQAALVTINGTITEPVTFMSEGAFHRYGIQFFYDNLVDNVHFDEIPDSVGNFTVDIPMSRPTPVYFEYNSQIGYLFLTPGDAINLSFVGNNLNNTMKVEGKGWEHNQYLAKWRSRFDNDLMEESLAAKKAWSQSAYNMGAEEFHVQELSFLNDYLRVTSNTSREFKNWAKAEIDYRYANRLSTFYYDSEYPQADGYRNFAKSYNFKDEDALSSREYQNFLDNHLRQLALRDPADERAARKANRIPWTVRGIELAKSEYKGEVQTFMLAKFTLNLIDAEYAQANQYYDAFTATYPQSEYLETMHHRFGKYSDYVNAPPPPDARLTVVNDANAITFQQLLDKYKGKVVLLDFWASWCAPCLSEMPFSNKLHHQFRDKDVTFVYLASDDTDGKWRGNIARYKLSGEHYLMNSSLQRDAYLTLMVQTLPRYVLIDQNGKIVNPDSNKPSQPELAAAIEALLKGGN